MTNTNREKVVLFGARAIGHIVHDWVADDSDVVCFVDNDASLWGTRISGKEVRSPECLGSIDYDRIIVCTWALGCIREQLSKLGVDAGKIDESHAIYTIRAREVWLKDFARCAHERNIPGSVAEAGVYLGGYAKRINEAFPDRTLYLFDTFSGFDERDVALEDGGSWTQGSFRGSSLEGVKAVMPHLDKCVFKVGRFPETAADVDATFCFVHLDMDLYLPTLAGLRFFYPRLAKGGVLAVHDFFSHSFPNVKKAVYEFVDERGGEIALFPLGDAISIGMCR